MHHAIAFIVRLESNFRLIPGSFVSVSHHCHQTLCRHSGGRPSLQLAVNAVPSFVEYLILIIELCGFSSFASDVSLTSLAMTLVSIIISLLVCIADQIQSYSCKRL